MGRKESSRHTIIKTLNVQNEERMLKPARGKNQVTYKGRLIGITPDFSVDTLKARKSLGRGLPV